MTPDFDVVVIGAGIHGTGIAQAVAAAGHTVCIVEQRHPAAGTSSKSSKLIHGGLRYLESGQLSLVRHSLAERNLLLRIAPGLVHALPMHIPVYRGMRRNAALTRAVLNSATALGARVRMPAEFIEAEPGAAGIDCTIREGGRDSVLRARVLVNAAGPWAAAVAARIRPVRAPPAMELVKGSHVEYEGAPARGAFYIEAPQDGRAVFVLPYGNRTLVGTTEVPYRGDPAEVGASDDERVYLHEAFARCFPARAGAQQVDAWAGLRVLPAAATDAFNRPRDTVFDLDDRRRPTMLAIYGGKLTTWRTTARHALRLLAPSLPPAARVADTATLPLG
ncbi:MAG: FAD-dependent oxidoreductase [Xanthomonadaceae bacterium]|nr:FAD-dependent oxidoreductase [Xanthomonadaceae bacterium]